MNIELRDVLLTFPILCIESFTLKLFQITVSCDFLLISFNEVILYP